MDFLDLEFLLSVGQTIAIVLLWLRKPGQDAMQRVEYVDGRVDVIEERLKHMPSTDDLTELEGTVRAISAQIGGMEDTVKTTRNTVQRIEDFLRSNR